jgi:hypothetical protein
MLESGKTIWQLTASVKFYFITDFQQQLRYALVLDSYGLKKPVSEKQSSFNARVSLMMMMKINYNGVYRILFFS